VTKQSQKRERLEEDTTRDGPLSIKRLDNDAKVLEFIKLKSPWVLIRLHQTSSQTAGVLVDHPEQQELSSSQSP
jgi:hypothetical protein